MQIPGKGSEVPLETIKEICLENGLATLWEKIENDPPALPFKSDGCSMWFNGWQGYDLYPACFLHDLKYWAGYTDKSKEKEEAVERLIADAQLMIDVARILKDTRMAQTMFLGVRLGGHPVLKLSFSWGFGRQ